MYFYSLDIPSLIPPRVQSEKDKARVVIEEINKAALETLRGSSEHKDLILKMRTLAVKAVSSTFQIEVTYNEDLFDFLTRKEESPSRDLTDSSEESVYECKIKPIMREFCCESIDELKCLANIVESTAQANELGRELRKDGLLTRKMISFGVHSEWIKDILTGYDDQPFK